MLDLKALKPVEEVSYAALRIISGLAFSQHGFQKVLGVLTDKETADLGQMWIGGAIELFGGLMISLGLLTRGAAFLASGTMAVAYIQFHWKFQFDEKFFPVKNGGELALVYCFLFLLFTLRGGGPVSIDRLLFGRRER